MEEKTLKGAAAELAAPTLQDVSGIQASLLEDGKIPNCLLLGVRSEDPEIRKAVVTKIREILQTFGGFPPSQVVQPIVDTGLVPDLVSLLDSDDTRLQSEVACIVANLACGTAQQTRKVVDAGAISKLARLAASPNEDVSDNAVWALANITDDSSVHRNRVEDEGGINALVAILNDADLGPTNTQRRAVWAILCYLHPWPPRPPIITRMKHILPCLVRYILDTSIDEANMESLQYAVRALERICCRGLPRSDFVETGVVPRLTQLLADSSSSVALQKQVLMYLSYLVRGDDDDIDVAVNAGLLPALSVALAGAGGDQLVHEIVCWNASNITARNRRQVQAFLDSGLLEPIVRILMDGQNSTGCRRYACSAISNLTAEVADDKVRRAVIEGHCLDGLAAALLTPDCWSRELAVLGITNVLEWKGSQAPEADSSPLAILRCNSCAQNLRAVRDSRELGDLKLKNDCHDILTRYFPEYSRRARV
ncbi:Importin subunit alpha-4 [Tulasnella sp. 424]|nr:Importin subunit alpha-4 [Tulasnella sp. 424]